MSEVPNSGFGDDAVGQLAFHLWLRNASGDGNHLVTWGPDAYDISRFLAKAKAEAHTQLLRERAARALDIL